MLGQQLDNPFRAAGSLRDEQQPITPFTAAADIVEPLVQMVPEPHRGLARNVPGTGVDIERIDRCRSVKPAGYLVVVHREGLRMRRRIPPVLRSLVRGSQLRHALAQPVSRLRRSGDDEVRARCADIVEERGGQVRRGSDPVLLGDFRVVPIELVGQRADRYLIERRH